MKKLLAVAAMSAMLLAFNVVAVSQDSQSDADPVFARINDMTISQSEFEAIFQAAVRQKYYHGKVLANELDEFRKKVTDDIVTQVLVHDQAMGLGLQPDRKKIDEGIDAFNLKNAANPNWEQRRDKVIPRMIEQLERQDLIEQMEARIRDLSAPATDEVRRYYDEQPEKFTEPQHLRVSGILLHVAPAAGEKAWIETEQQADGYYQRILAGADFAELAKQYSNHPSAVNGGDLGYLHQGMLDDEVQQMLETLSPGQTGEPLRVLEGIALFRLENIQPAKLRPFEEVKERAAGLLYREMQDHAWQAYVKTLRSSANVYVNQ